MATNPAQRYTADDMLKLPLPDGISGYEFVDGEPVPVMPASRIHGRLIIKVGARLEAYVASAGIAGEVFSDSGFVLGLARDRERMRGPDVSFVSDAKLRTQPDPERLFRCVPDLAIEIDLASGRKKGGQQRIVEYLEAGVPLVWSIDPRTRSATVYRQDGSVDRVAEEGVLDGEAVVPGFRLSLADLFQRR